VPFASLPVDRPTQARARQAIALLKFVPEQQLRQLKEAVQTSPAAAAAGAVATAPGTSTPAAAAPSAAPSAPAAPSAAAAAFGSANAGSSVSAAAEVAQPSQQQEQQQDKQENLLEVSPPAKKQKLNQLLNNLFEDGESAEHKQQIGSSSNSPVCNCTAAVAPHVIVSASNSNQQSLPQEQPEDSRHSGHQQQHQQQPPGDKLVVPACQGDSQSDTAAGVPQPPAVTSSVQLGVEELDEEQERQELLDRKCRRQEALQQAVCCCRCCCCWCYCCWQQLQCHCHLWCHQQLLTHRLAREDTSAATGRAVLA